MSEYIVGIYCRLSKDDDRQGESQSIGTQKSILKDFCENNGHDIYDYYIDDGFSGTNFNRPDFQRLLDDIEQGRINMVVTKDLSRLGRNYIMTGYYSEIYFPEHGTRCIALNDNFDSSNVENDLAPFKNILNDMYARDISRKIKTAKHQIAKSGLFIGSQAPYGYKRSNDNKKQLVIDDNVADVVQLIFALALQENGTVSIAKTLNQNHIISPSAYKSHQGDSQFTSNSGEIFSKAHEWNPITIRLILKNPVYIGNLTSLKTESAHHKTKHRRSVPQEGQIVTCNAHETLVSREDFEKVQEILSSHQCPAKMYRDNIFRGVLYCSECGHPLSIAHRKLKYTEDDCYRCTYHFKHPEICKHTHSIYHQVLCDHVLSELHALARAMKQRKVQTELSKYEDLKELTAEVLNSAIKRIEVGHISRKTKIKNAVIIHWKL